MNNLTGVYRALVVDNVDPEGHSRVRVQVPQIMGGNISGWAYPVPNGVSVPAIGSQVWVAFEGGDPSFPLYYGAVLTDLTAINTHLSTVDTHLTNIDGHLTTVDGHLTTIDGHLTTLDGEVSSISGAAVTLTGNQSISGTKTFTTGIVAINGLFTNAAPCASATGTGASSAGQWARLARITITTQFSDVAVAWSLQSSGTGSAYANRAIVDVRVKQQNAMASAPFISVFVTKRDQLQPGQVRAITTTNTAGSTVVDIYVQNNLSYDALMVEELNYQASGSGTITYYTNAAYVTTATLPAGTQTPGIASESGQPTAMISMFGGSAAPFGWLLCNGAAVSRAVYSDLFGVIGTTYGVGDGSTTFNVPDMRQRFPIGVAASGTGSTLGGTGGTIDHTHTAGTISSDPGHSHAVDPPATASDSQGGHGHTVGAASVTGTTSGDTHSHTVAVAAHTHSVDVASFNSGSGVYSSLSSNVSTSSSTFGPPGHYHVINPPSTVSGSGGAQTPTSSGNTHSHTVGVSGSVDAAAGHAHTTDIGSFSSSGAGVHSHTQAASGTGNPPFLAVNFIIKA